MTTETLNRRAAVLAAIATEHNGRAKLLRGRIEELKLQLDEHVKKEAEAEAKLLESMRALDTKEIVVTHFRITRHDSTAKVVFDELRGEPTQWLPRELTRTTVEPDKTAIRAAIEHGTAPAGVSLQRGEYIKIKRVGA